MTTSQVDLHPLDNAVWSSLTGPHAHFAVGTGLALRYPPDVSPFIAVPPVVDAEVWVDLAELVGPGELLALSGPPTLLDQMPAGWSVEMRGEGVQLVSTDAFATAPEPAAVVLGEADVPEMLDLVARTQPGPFLPRTHLLGTYLGIRVDGRLVAMAGERMHPPGYTEISAVCTDAGFRGQGLATRLVRAVGHGIRQRGDVPMLHAAAENTNAIRLYESIGFVLRRRTHFFGLRTPGNPAATPEPVGPAGP